MFPMSGDSTIDIGIWLVLLIFASSIHESAHAWVAYLCGDDTGKNEGRISLNPMVHISLVESILLPAALLIMTQGRFIFGGAKPVAIAAYKLRHPDRDMALSAAAGPMSNLLLVLVASLILFASKAVTIPQGVFYGIINFIILNLLLALFNLIPIPPLDGSRIFRYLIPPLRGVYDGLDQWGMVILIVLLLYIPETFTFISAAISFGIRGVLYIYQQIPY